MPASKAQQKRAEDYRDYRERGSLDLNEKALEEIIAELYDLFPLAMQRRHLGEKAIRDAFEGHTNYSQIASELAVVETMLQQRAQR